MARSSVNRDLLEQAKTAASLRYQPALQALAALRSSKRSEYIDGVRQAREAARIIAAANQEASGGLSSFLSRVNGMQTPGPSSSEAAIVANNLGLTGQAAGAMLANSTSRAAQGSVYQRQALRKSYLGDIGQIDQQAANLADQYGTYVTDAYGKLVSANDEAAMKARESAANRRNQRLVAGVDASGQVIPGGKADKPKKSTGTLPGGVKPLTGSEFRSFQNAYRAGSSIAGRFAQKVRQGKLSLSDAASALTEGIGSTDRTVVIRNPETGEVLRNRDGTPKTRQEKVPGVKGVGDPVAARAAMEVALYGGITSQTARALHAQGISAKRLGVRVLSNTQRKKVTQNNQTVDSAVDVVSQVVGSLGFGG